MSPQNYQFKVLAKTVQPDGRYTISFQNIDALSPASFTWHNVIAPQALQYIPGQTYQFVVG